MTPNITKKIDDYILNILKFYQNELMICYTLYMSVKFTNMRK